MDKISKTGAEWHVDCGAVVEIETRCRIPIWRTFGRIQWHVIPEPRITLQGAATWWIHCHDFRVTCHIAGCKNSTRHIENRLCHILFFFVFNVVQALTSGGFRIVSDTLVNYSLQTLNNRFSLFVFLSFFDCSMMEIVTVIGPYFSGYLPRRIRPICGKKCCVWMANKFMLMMIRIIVHLFSCDEIHVNNQLWVVLFKRLTLL